MKNTNKGGNFFCGQNNTTWIPGLVFPAGMALMPTFENGSVFMKELSWKRDVAGVVLYEIKNTNDAYKPQYVNIPIPNSVLQKIQRFGETVVRNLNSPRVWEQAAKVAVTGLGLAALYGIMASGGITGIISALNAPTTAGASLAITAASAILVTAAYNQLQNQN